MDIVITSAGLQSLINAEQTGTNAVKITQVGVGSGKYVPTKDQTELRSEIKRLPVTEGGQTGQHEIHVALQDNSAESYAVYEFGLFLSDGTLFAVYSQTGEAILNKLATSNALLAIDVALEDVNAEQITFGDVTYTVAAGTTENAGIIELATEEETQAGTDAQRAVTPAGLKTLTTNTERAGLSQVATQDETNAGTDGLKAVTPQTLKTAVDIRAASGIETVEGKLTEKFVTPLGLRSLTATTGRNGLVELATETEAEEGTDKTRAVTPAGVRSAIVKQTPDAREDLKGIIQLASDLEATEGVDELKAITPATMKTAVDARAATEAEVVAGVSKTKFLTPQQFKVAAGKLAIDNIYPVGAIYMSVNSTDPAVLFGGVWKPLDQGRVLIGAGAAHPAGETGGAETHTLTVGEMPAHNHTGSSSTAGAHTHTRGTMEITGAIPVDDHKIRYVEGAFYQNGNYSNCDNRDSENGSPRASFAASRTWSGETSSAGSHSHTVDTKNTGGNHAHNNMQPYLAVYMWTRIE